MKKWILTTALTAVVFFGWAAERPWRPVQYYLEWDTVSNAEYELYHCGQGMNDVWWTTNEQGEYVVPIAITNKDFSMWNHRVVESNPLHVFQGTSQAGVKFFIVAFMTNNGTYKTSNIVSWPTNWMTPPNGFGLRLIRMPLGPPMYQGPLPSNFTPTGLTINETNM